MSDYVAGILKAKRKQLKLSVKYVIEQLHQYDLDISDKTLYSWESGHRQPDADSFLALCDIYGITSFKEIEKSPAPAEADTGEKVDPMVVYQALISMGFVKEGEDLSNADLAFFMGIGEIIRAWFASRNSE